jgi:hypothetical protein
MGDALVKLGTTRLAGHIGPATAVLSRGARLTAKAFAAELGIAEADALPLLFAFEQDGQARHRHTFFCPDTERMIAEFDGRAAAALPEYLECTHHGGDAVRHRTDTECFAEVSWVTAEAEAAGG